MLAACRAPDADDGVEGVAVELPEALDGDVDEDEEGEPPGSSGVFTDGVVTGGVVTDGVVSEGVLDGVVTDGVLTTGVETLGVVTEGVVTDGVLTVGVGPTGVVTRGVVSDGTVTDGTVTCGVVTAGRLATGVLIAGNPALGSVAALPASGWLISTASAAAGPANETILRMPRETLAVGKTCGFRGESAETPALRIPGAGKLRLDRSLRLDARPRRMLHAGGIIFPSQPVWSTQTMESSQDEFADLHVPDSPGDHAIAQDEEWFGVSVDGQPRRIRFHDYGAIYAVPGLYERIFYEELECRSPKTVVGLLKRELERDGTDPASLTALDLGAGNGIVGEELRAIGVSSIVGVDLLPEAAAAAARDRPAVYDDYLVADLTELSDAERRRLSKRNFNCLISVAALGFDDIPPEALATAYDQVRPGGWIALTIKEDFLTTEDPSGFQKLIRRMIDEQLLDLRTHERYRHRLSSNGQPLYYVALIAVKNDDRAATELVSD